MLFKVQAVFRPQIVNGRTVNGSYTDEQLNAMGFLLTTPVENIEASDRNEAFEIIRNKYEPLVNIPHPKISFALFD